MWTHCQPAVTASNLDLDVMFDFLKEERHEIKGVGAAKEAELKKINEEFSSLDHLWKEAEKVRKLMNFNHILLIIYTFLFQFSRLYRISLLFLALIT